MKKHLLLLLLLSFSIWTYSQVPLITISADSICAGDTVYASVSQPIIDLSGTTGSNQQNGLMFDITAKEDFVVKDFVINNITSSTTIEVYSRIGSFDGHENTPGSWTLIGTANNVPAGTDIPLNLNLEVPVIIGQTRAFYITTTTTSHYIEYATSYDPVGTILSGSLYFDIKVGIGKMYPFSATYSPRSFIGKILYSPALISTKWNTGDTTSSIDIVPNRSIVLSARLEMSGNYNVTTKGRAVIVSEVDVTATANPYSVASGNSSILSATTLLSRGISTTMEEGNSQNGAMFDVETTHAIIIEGFTINFISFYGADVEIMYKTGTHVGYEGDAGAWTSIATFQQIPGDKGVYLPLNLPLSVAANETVSFYITRTDLPHTILYTNGTQVGQTAASAPGVRIKEGVGVQYPFGAVFSPRILNTIMHYSVMNPPGSSFSWDVGGSGGSIIVSPSLTTTYTLTITHQGCMAQDTVQVTVLGTGINEKESIPFNIYPNPATDLLVVETPVGETLTEYYLTDMQGKVVSESIIQSNSDRLQIPVSNIKPGAYLLHMTVNGQKNSFRIIISR